MDLEKDYDFLATACGLASSLDWQYYPPREVPPMGSPPTRPRQDVEEYYLTRRSRNQRGPGMMPEWASN
jgi:hypothetical protein